MPLGTCRHCGHSPVAENACVCPRCAGDSPNPNDLKTLVTVVALSVVGIPGGLLLGAVGCRWLGVAIPRVW